MASITTAPSVAVGRFSRRSRGTTSSVPQGSATARARRVCRPGRERRPGSARRCVHAWAVRVGHPRAGKRMRGMTWLEDVRLSERELANRGIEATAALGRDDPLWPGQLATFAALLLYLALPAALTIGPRWPLPAAESALLAALVIAARGGREATRHRRAAIGLVLVAVAANLVSLGMLTHYLLAGGHARARRPRRRRRAHLVHSTSCCSPSSTGSRPRRAPPTGRRPGARRAGPAVPANQPTAATPPPPGSRPSATTYTSP